MHALFFAGATPDRALDRIVGHVAGFRIVDCLAQPRVAIRIAATRASGDGYFLDEFSEQFAALGIERALLMLDTMPLRVSGHGNRSLNKWHCVWAAIYHNPFRVP